MYVTAKGGPDISLRHKSFHVDISEQASATPTTSIFAFLLVTLLETRTSSRPNENPILMHLHLHR
jgi:hypothetical protein